MIDKEVLLPKIEKSLNSIRPYLEADGGDVEVLDIDEDGVVSIKWLGACKSCKMSVMTLKGGVEEAIMKAVPEVTSVKAINDADTNAAASGVSNKAG